MTEAQASECATLSKDKLSTSLAPEGCSPIPTLAEQALGNVGGASLKVDHTSLPPELWLDIFRYATRVPRARSIAPEDPFEPERPADYARGMNSPIESMRTKCALVRVCHAWRSLAIELLYEHVVLGSGRLLDMFCRTLRESRKEVVESEDGSKAAIEGLGHGRWVRHLEVQLWSMSKNSHSFWRSVIISISFCSRLRVFSGVWQKPAPSGFLPVLMQYLPSALEELCWQQDSVCAVDELPLLTTPALEKFPTLRVLDLGKICVVNPERCLQQSSFHTINFPYVTHLALPTCPLLLRYATKQVMPALRYLVLDAAGAHPTVYAPLVARELASFLEVHGRQLRTVELLPSKTQSLRPGPISVSSFLSPTTCPILETLVFDMREKVVSISPQAHFRLKQEHQQQQQAAGPSKPQKGPTATANAPDPPVVNLEYFNASPPCLPLLDVPHPTLRRVGIRGMSISKLYPNKPNQAQAHLEAFVAYRSLFPALEVVRTLGFLVDTSTDPIAPDLFIWWTEKFERAGVDLQDGEGVVWMTEEPDGKPGGKEADRSDVEKGQVAAEPEQKDVAG